MSGLLSAGKINKHSMSSQAFSMATSGMQMHAKLLPIRCVPLVESLVNPMARREGIECTFCHDQLLGKTLAEAIADAKAIGWEIWSDGWHCADCIIEEESL